MKKALKNNANYLPQVREQYENYPYPPRDPQQEKNRFYFVYSCALDSINYYHYAGKRDFSKGFRVLVVGGGTGDAAIMFAEQFREMDADIIYLDISLASMQVAKDRAKVRALDNITWVHGSLLEARNLLDGKFDYINCIGVLHHLESPEAGLAALASVLKEDGVIELMLYAKYGRESVYQIQNLMRLLNKNENDMRHKVENCKSMLQDLPSSSSFKRVESVFNDIPAYGDTGIYDLFLHSHDVAYSVPDLYRFLETSHLKLTHLFFDRNMDKGNNLYKPESYSKAPNLLRAMNTMSAEEKQAAAELIHGGIIKHLFYAAKTIPPLPSLDDLDNVPSLSIYMRNESYENIYNAVKNFMIGEEIGFKVDEKQISFIKTPHTDLLCKYLNGQRSLGEIFKDVRASFPATEKKPTVAELKKEFEAIFNAFNLMDLMFLRHKSVSAAKTVADIQQRITDLYRASNHSG